MPISEAIHSDGPILSRTAMLRQNLTAQLQNRLTCYILQATKRKGGASTLRGLVHLETFPRRRPGMLQDVSNCSYAIAVIDPKVISQWAGY